MSYGTVAQLRVVELDGPISRELIVRESTTMYNLHRAVQFCIKPKQADDTVSSKAFKFYDGSGKKLVKAVKENQLSRNNVNKAADAKVGDSYIYEFGDGKKKRQFQVEIVALDWQDARYEVPRCIAGWDGSAAVDVDPINKKLLVRSFSKAKTGQRKQTRGFLCMGPVSDEEVMGWHMAAMKEGIVPVSDKPTKKKTVVKTSAAADASNKKPAATKTTLKKPAATKPAVERNPMLQTAAARRAATKKKAASAAAAQLLRAKAAAMKKTASKQTAVQRTSRR